MNNNPGNSLYNSFKNRVRDNFIPPAGSRDTIWRLWHSLYNGLNDSLGDSRDCGIMDSIEQNVNDDEETNDA